MEFLHPNLRRVHLLQPKSFRHAGSSSHGVGINSTETDRKATEDAVNEVSSSRRAETHLALHHSDPRQPPAAWLLFVGPGVHLPGKNKPSPTGSKKKLF